MGHNGILWYFNGIYWDIWWLPPGKRLQKAMERSSILQLGKSTISMAMFKSYVTNYQRVAIDLKNNQHSDELREAHPALMGMGL